MAMRERLGGFDSSNQQQLDTLQQLFGAEGVEAVSLLGPALDQLTTAQREVADSTGLLRQSYQYFLDSTGGKVKIFGNQMKLLGESFAGALTPVLGGGGVWVDGRCRRIRVVA